MKLRKDKVFQLGLDFSLCLLVGILFLVTYFTVKPFERGFFCDDASIQYPYHPDTVSIGMCTGSGIAIALISFVAVEFSLSARMVKEKLFELLWFVGKTFIVFLVGAGLTMVVIEVGKLTIGRPRPHFLDVCRPDYSKINCSLGYIEDFTCTNAGGYSKKVLSEVRKSFPSGHSGFAAYTALFLSVYYQVRLGHMTRTYLLQIVLQLAVTVGAVYIILSRVSDYKHHWSDVLTGSVVGLLGALWTILCLGRHLGLLGPVHRCEQLVKQSDNNISDLSIRRLSSMERGVELHDEINSPQHSRYGTK